MDDDNTAPDYQSLSDNLKSIVNDYQAQQDAKPQPILDFGNTKDGSWLTGDETTPWYARANPEEVNDFLDPQKMANDPQWHDKYQASGLPDLLDGLNNEVAPSTHPIFHFGNSTDGSWLHEDPPAANPAMRKSPVFLGTTQPADNDKKSPLDNVSDWMTKNIQKPLFDAGTWFNKNVAAPVSSAVSQYTDNVINNIKNTDMDDLSTKMAVAGLANIEDPLGWGLEAGAGGIRIVSGLAKAAQAASEATKAAEVAADTAKTVEAAAKGVEAATDAAKTTGTLSDITAAIAKGGAKDTSYIPAPEPPVTLKVAEPPPESPWLRGEGQLPVRAFNNGDEVADEAVQHDMTRRGNSGPPGKRVNEYGSEDNMRKAVRDAYNKNDRWIQLDDKGNGAADFYPNKDTNDVVIIPRDSSKPVTGYKVDFDRYGVDTMEEFLLGKNCRKASL